MMQKRNYWANIDELPQFTHMSARYTDDWRYSLVVWERTWTKHFAFLPVRLFEGEPKIWLRSYYKNKGIMWGDDKKVSIPYIRTCIRYATDTLDILRWD